MRKGFPAVLYQHQDVFEVFLPDFDECVVGLTLEEAVEEAFEIPVIYCLAEEFFL